MSTSLEPKPGYVWQPYVVSSPASDTPGDVDPETGPRNGCGGGEIIIDEEIEGFSRITLEHVKARHTWEISCGIYGWFVHTSFCSNEQSAWKLYEEMKMELESIVAQVDRIDLSDEAASEVMTETVLEMIRSLVERTS